MVRKKKVKLRKFSAVMLAMLMIISSFTSQLSFAAEQKPKSFSKEELLLEKQREQTAASEKAAEQERTSEESSEMAKLLDGLGIDPPPLKGDQAIATEIKKEAALLKAFEKEQELDVIIRMKDQPDLSKIYPQVKAKKNRVEKIKAIQDHLKEKADNSQKGIQQALSALETKGKAKKKDSLWIKMGLLLQSLKKLLKK
ncbi:hypothetical protein [Bacillus sp. ISL-55]|uniref:hypothetical protein n=1 Tax=Bacillus sp. ISL-55 TaxID=2819134 RepID=UPI001BE72AFB|nr:hypothetical protein [Bacillus sp. ISL-55]MBT2692542.1 hypothetical protein [Bacillus sp. ISL-55]